MDVVVKQGHSQHCHPGAQSLHPVWNKAEQIALKVNQRSPKQDGIVDLVNQN